MCSKRLGNQFTVVHTAAEKSEKMRQLVSVCWCKSKRKTTMQAYAIVFFPLTVLTQVSDSLVDTIECAMYMPIFSRPKERTKAMT